MSRNYYANLCRDTNQTVLSNKYLLKYERDKNGHHIGVVIAFKDENGRVKIGWSRCHAKLEKFDKHIGINKAINRAKPYKEIDERDAPHSLQSELTEMIERAQRYFQLTNKS